MFSNVWKSNLLAERLRYLCTIRDECCARLFRVNSEKFNSFLNGLNTNYPHCVSLFSYTFLFVLPGSVYVWYKTNLEFLDVITDTNISLRMKEVNFIL